MQAKLTQAVRAYDHLQTERASLVDRQRFEAAQRQQQQYTPAQVGYGYGPPLGSAYGPPQPVGAYGYGGYAPPPAHAQWHAQAPYGHPPSQMYAAPPDQPPYGAPPPAQPAHGGPAPSTAAGEGVYPTLPTSPPPAGQAYASYQATPQDPQHQQLHQTAEPPSSSYPVEPYPPVGQPLHSHQQQHPTSPSEQMSSAPPWTGNDPSRPPESSHPQLATLYSPVGPPEHNQQQQYFPPQPQPNTSFPTAPLSDPLDRGFPSVPSAGLAEGQPEPEKKHEEEEGLLISF